MSDHVMASEGPQSEGAWPGGWLWSLVTAMVAAVLARWLGAVSVQAAVLLGLMVFVVYSVLLAQFWEAPVSEGFDHGHGHSDHGHDDHGSDDHGRGDHGRGDHGHGDHGQLHGHDAHSNAPAVMTAPVAAVAPVAMVAPVASVPPVAPVAPVPPIASVAPVTTVAPAASDTMVAGMAPVAEAAAVAAATAPIANALKPQALAAARNGKSDVLQEIEGVGPSLEKLCHDLGIFHFDQIASWGPAEIAWMDGNLKGFKGRVTRDKWVPQARLIVAEGVDAFRIRAKSNKY